MNKPRLIYYNILKYQKDNLVLLNKYFEVIVLEDPSKDTDSLLENADVCLAPLGYFFGKDKIDKCKKLKCIGTNTTGVPHIDMEYSELNGIKVYSLKDQQEFLETITPTAEHTWGLLLALTRNIIPATNSVLDGNWDRRPFGGRNMLSRLSLGVIGYGRLGKRVAQFGKAFGMNVRYFDPFQNESDIEKVDDLAKLVSQSDVVSLHVPALNETKNLINSELLSSFKKGSYFINTARGELVDDDALLKVLESGLLAGAALDVLDGEFAPDFDVRNHPLYTYAKDHSNLLLTPHIAGSTYDAWFETERRIIDMIIKGCNAV